jgi:hypothetical protein
MTAFGAQLVRRLQGVKTPVDARVLALLEEPETRVVGELRGGSTTAHTIAVWRPRTDHLKEIGSPADGAEGLIAALEGRAPQRKVEQVSLVGNANSCVIFFDWSTREFLGYLLMERRSKAEERQRMERLENLFASKIEAASPPESQPRTELQTA